MCTKPYAGGLGRHWLPHTSGGPPHSAAAGVEGQFLSCVVSVIVLGTHFTPPGVVRWCPLRVVVLGPYVNSAWAGSCETCLIGALSMQKSMQIQGIGTGVMFHLYSDRPAVEVLMMHSHRCVGPDTVPLALERSYLCFAGDVGSRSSTRGSMLPPFWWPRRFKS